MVDESLDTTGLIVCLSVCLSVRLSGVGELMFCSGSRRMSADASHDHLLSPPKGLGSLPCPREREGEGRVNMTRRETMISNT